MLSRCDSAAGASNRSVVVKVPSSTTLDFLDYVQLAANVHIYTYTRNEACVCCLVRYINRFALQYGRKYPVPFEKRCALAYDLFDLGGQENVSKDDMDRVLRAISKAHGVFAVDGVRQSIK